MSPPLQYGRRQLHSALSRIRKKLSARDYDRQIKKYYLNHPDKQNAVILPSFPKSGNTWIRFIFANIISLSELDGRTVDYHVLSDILPADGFHDDLRRDWPYRSLPCILKTHKAHRPIFDSFRTFFLYRNPLDTMISNYNYFSSRVAPASDASKADRELLEGRRFSGDPSGYLRTNLPRWCRHYLSWKGRSTVEVSYEAMRANPIATCTDLLATLSCDVPTDILELAVERSDISRIQRLEDETGTSSKMAQLSGRFARSGAVGQWTDLFDRDDLDFAYGCLDEFAIPRSQFRFT